MSLFKNKYNEIWAGWKILIVMVVFLITTVVFSLAASFAYCIIAVLQTGEADPVAITQRMMNDSMFYTLSGSLQNVAVIFSVVLFWKVFDKRPLKDMGLTSIQKGGKDFVYGLLIGAVTISMIFMVLLISRQISVENDLTQPNFSWTLLFDLILMIFVGFGEEMFSRGYCMSVFRRSNVYVMFIIPNIIFSLLHIFNNAFSVIPMINIFLIGILFSFMFYKRGNIWMPIGYHITWNYFQGSVFGLPVSGSSVNGMYTSKLLSENIFNGGAFGPEGGLLVTFMIVASIALFYFVTKTKEADTAANAQL